jgi:transcriptional repressor NrdR
VIHVPVGQADMIDPDHLAGGPADVKGDVHLGDDDNRLLAGEGKALKADPPYRLLGQSRSHSPTMSASGGFAKRAGEVLLRFLDGGLYLGPPISVILQIWCLPGVVRPPVSGRHRPAGAVPGTWDQSQNMRCPYCKEINQDKVIDSRLSEGGEVIRRRRVCQFCHKRFTTKERVENEVKLLVIKRDETRVPYDRAKILAGVQRACYKRPVEEESLMRLVDAVEDSLFKEYDREVSSQTIGALVAERLRELDQIAYIRFASVYRRFADLGELIDEAKSVCDRARSDVPGQQSLFD